MMAVLGMNPTWSTCWYWLSFVAFGRFNGTVDGQIITFFVMTVAAAEAAVGLALVIALFRGRESLNPDAFTSLKW